MAIEIMQTEIQRKIRRTEYLQVTERYCIVYFMWNWNCQRGREIFKERFKK